MIFRETLTRWLRKERNDSFRCPACQNPLPREQSFCPHCYMVLRPDGMAELHHALQGAKVREDIYILRQLHHGDGEGVTLLTHAPPLESKSPPSPHQAEEVPPRPPGQETGSPPRTPKPRKRNQKLQEPVTHPCSTAPPPSVNPKDLPGLIRWFLDHDRSVPNNVAILEEAHRSIYGGEHSSTYEQHLAWVIGDDLRMYDSRDLLEEHLRLQTTVYGRTIQALRRLGSHHPGFQSPADLPEAERQEMSSLCHQLGLTATRLRVEGWAYQLRYGEPPPIKKVAPERRSGVRAQARSRNSR